MLNSKKNLTVALFVSTIAVTNANAQFFDLTEQGSTTQINKPTGNYQSSPTEIFNADKIETNPQLETSGDEGGFVSAQDPDLESMKNENSFNAFPVANGFDAFSSESLVSEEKVKDQIRDLNQLDSIGYLDANFDEALWLGVSYDYAKARFDKVDSIKSVHIKNIVRNMLMTKARPPKSENSWLELRMNTLLSMGKLSDVKLLLKEVKSKELLLLKHEGLSSLYIQANMLEEGIFSFIKESLKQNPSNLNYKKALLISLYKQGKTSQAKLTFNALNDIDKTVEESNFGKLFTSLLNSESLDVSGLSKLDTFDQYLIALNPSIFTNINFTNFTDQTLLSLIENTSEKDNKVKYAEILMNKFPYSYNIDYLTSTYLMYNFEPKDLSTPLNFIQKSDNDFEKRALLYQASKVNGLNSTKALSLKKLWESYRAAKLNNIKFLITEKTQNISVNSSIAWFSIDLLKNELKQAQIEYSTLKTLYENIDNTYSNANILNLQIAVEFLRKTSVITSNFDKIQEYKETLDAWFNANKIETKQDYNYVLKVLTLLDALEGPIPDEMWAKLYEKSYLESKVESNPVWLRLMTSSVEKDEKGKSLLLIAEKFANNTENTLDPQTLANIIAALNFLNMPQEMAMIGMNSIIK